MPESGVLPKRNAPGLFLAGPGLPGLLLSCLGLLSEPRLHWATLVLLLGCNWLPSAALGTWAALGLVISCSWLLGLLLNVFRLMMGAEIIIQGGTAEIGVSVGRRSK